MQSIVKNRFFLLGIGFLSLPIIVPVISSISNVIFTLGVELGTNIRYILEGFSC